jgi:tripartite-type tricarboxylate transporter receptor subunit TctC
MTMKASSCLTFASALAVLFASTAVRSDDAADYPNRPVQVVVSWAPGGSVASIARVLSASMSEVLGEPYVVLTRDGGAGLIGTASIANAKPDGYIIGFGPITPITNALHLMKNKTFSIDSFEYVCQAFENMFSVAVPENSPYTSIQQLVQDIVQKPDMLTYGHLGRGSLSHLSFANIVQSRDLKITEVPYRGENALMTDLLAGRIDFGIVTVGGMVGKPVRLLGVFGNRRHPGFPNVPQMSEADLPSLQPALNGIIVPKGTPEAIVGKLESACQKATQTASFTAFMGSIAEPVVYRGREDFTKQAHLDNKEKAELIARLGLEAQ